MRVLNNQQMKLLDKVSIVEYKIPGIVLMENAGISAYEEILKTLSNDCRKKVVIVCGTGNNGGDGFVIARHLYNNDIQVKVYIIGDIKSLKEDAKINYQIIKRMRIPVAMINDDDDIIDFNLNIMKSDLIIDSLYGTGLVSEIKGIGKDIINVINNTKKKVISIDIPSGISGDTGKVLGTAIKADKTISYQLPKIGNVTSPAINYNGELIIKDIGIPKEAIKNSQYEADLITEEILRNIIPIRRRDSHKGDFGRALIVAGSKGMTGAAILCSKAALRCGIGMLRLAIPEELNDILETQLTEVMTRPFQKPNEDREEFKGIYDIIDDLKINNVATLGPGLGISKETEMIVTEVLKKSEGPIILDADALNVLKGNLNLLKLSKKTCILTPHPGEMERLTGIPKEEINKNRIKIARDFAKKWKVILVLKGSSTIVADYKGNVCINTTGNPGMATAGSGDVLSGIITSFVAQKIDPFLATVASVYIHGKAGDIAASKKGEYGMIAGDMIEEIPEIILNI